ncbi:MAG: hypothetical protein ACK5KL_20650 [Dysgonomonas sp.]|jgi:F0F1-type ATP synthase assembly protein I|nr:hypothetical protein [Prevotella sp.]
MNQFKARLFSGLIGYGLLVGAIVAIILHNFFPGFSWNWYLGIFIFFIVVETFILNLVEKSSHSEDKKRLVNIYTLTKAIKIILSLVFVLVYYIIERSYNIKMFIIIYIVFYLLFLIAETFLFTKVEKHIKIKNNNE